MENKYLNVLKKLVLKAIKTNEVPVAAIIVKDDKIIAKAYNKKNKKNKVYLHAEVIAINKAIRKLKNWRLNNCDMYVTMKPCSMCEEIIKESRIKNVYFLIQNTKKAYNFTKYIQLENDYSHEYKMLLKSFFKGKRNCIKEE